MSKRLKVALLLGIGLVLAVSGVVVWNASRPEVAVCFVGRTNDAVGQLLELNVRNRSPSVAFVKLLLEQKTSEGWDLVLERQGAQSYAAGTVVFVAGNSTEVVDVRSPVDRAMRVRLAYELRGKRKPRLLEALWSRLGIRRPPEQWRRFIGPVIPPRVHGPAADTR